MTAFAGVPCRCGRPQGSSTHDERLKSVQHYHPYQPDASSLEAVAMKLLVALEQCEKWAGRPCRNTALAHPLDGRLSLSAALALAREATWRAAAIGITPPTDEASNG